MNLNNQITACEENCQHNFVSPYRLLFSWNHIISPRCEPLIGLICLHELQFIISHDSIKQILRSILEDCKNFSLLLSCAWPLENRWANKGLTFGRTFIAQVPARGYIWLCVSTHQNVVQLLLPLQKETPEGNRGEAVLRSEEDNWFAIDFHMSSRPAWIGQPISWLDSPSNQ
jgi:hypothetical protein